MIVCKDLLHETQTPIPVAFLDICVLIGDYPSWTVCDERFYKHKNEEKSLFRSQMKCVMSFVYTFHWCYWQSVVYFRSSSSGIRPYETTRSFIQFQASVTSNKASCLLDLRLNYFLKRIIETFSWNIIEGSLSGFLINHQICNMERPFKYFVIHAL